MYFNVNNSNFIVNNAYEAAIHITNTGDNAMIVNSTFINNTGTYEAAIANSSDYFTIFNSTFTNNDCTTGAINTSGIDGSYLPINYYTFIGNDATGSEAVINSGTTAVNCFANNSIFINNTAAGVGGAIANGAPVPLNNPPGENFTVLNSLFIGNRVTIPILYNVNAIFNLGKGFTINYCIFLNNTPTTSLNTNYRTIQLSGNGSH